MGTKDFKILFQEDEEDYLDDPITLFDFEEHTVFCSSKDFLRNITIEDPGDIVSDSEEDYEVQLQKSLLRLKELKKLKERNDNLLRKCRSCSIKVVDCHKFPWYYQNKLGATNKTQYLNTKHNVVEIEGKDKAEVTIIYLTSNEQVVYDNQYNKRVREEYTNNIEKNRANSSEFASVENAVGGRVRKQSKKILSKPVSNIQNESHTKIPSSEAEQATDLIISTYTRLTDKAIQHIKNNVEAYENSENIRHHLGNQLLVGSKSFIKNRDYLLKDTKKIEKETKVSKDNNNNDCDNVHDKKKNNKKCNKMKHVYTLEQISKTKIKIIKNSLKSKAIISIQNHYKKNKDKGRSLNREQYDYLKNIEKNDNATNQKQQNHCENKQERVQYNSYEYSYPSLSSPVLTNTAPEKNNATSLPNRNIGPDRFHGCNKPLIFADRIIPHFHKNAFLNHPDNLSKTKSNTKCTKETIYIYETNKNRNTFDSTEDLNIGPMVSQIPSLVNNNTMVNNNESHNRNTNADVSNISAIHSVSPSQDTYKLPVNNRILLKRSTHPDVVKENVNNYMRHSKETAEQLKKERLQYLLPSNLPDLHIQNIF